MKSTTVMGRPELASWIGRHPSRARHRFAIAGLSLALTAGLGTPALARVASRWWTLPDDAALGTVGLVVSIAFLGVGWLVGRRVDALSDEARRDPVTKVGNRRHWEESLSHEVACAVNAKMPISLLMLDVDNLKRLNDQHGHSAGDLALSIVGEVLGETCRSRDVAARFGGDEFALLLPRTRASEARVVAERIRAELAERRRCRDARLDGLLTISIGIADLTAIDEPTPTRIFEAADRALYAAKQAGRNRVVVFEKARATSRIIFLDERRGRKKNTRSSG